MYIYKLYPYKYKQLIFHTLKTPHGCLVYPSQLLQVQGIQINTQTEETSAANTLQGERQTHTQRESKLIITI